MQFMQPVGNKAVIVYDDGSDNDEIKFAEALSKEPDVQYKKIDVTPDFTNAVEALSKQENQMSK